MVMHLVLGTFILVSSSLVFSLVVTTTIVIFWFHRISIYYNIPVGKVKLNIGGGNIPMSGSRWGRENLIQTFKGP